MLIFAANIYRKGAERCPSGHARNIVESLSFWTAEIVHDGLAKVVAVGQRLANDLSTPCVYRLYSQFAVVSAAQQLHLIAELPHQLPADLSCLVVAFFIRNAISC